MPRDKVKTGAALAIYEYGMRMIDEAEGNILDAYEGTSYEPGIRTQYNRKRGHMKKLAREAGLSI
jgi:hypothetical protein